MIELWRVRGRNGSGRRNRRIPCGFKISSQFQPVPWFHFYYGHSYAEAPCFLWNEQWVAGCVSTQGVCLHSVWWCSLVGCVSTQCVVVLPCRVCVYTVCGGAPLQDVCLHSVWWCSLAGCVSTQCVVVVPCRVCVYAVCGGAPLQGVCLHSVWLCSLAGCVST